MTGTGTQADPYIITSVADLYSMETLGGAAVYFELGADIDFNGTPYAENFSPIPLKCLSFDGKGHSITNIFVSDSSSNSNLFTVPFQDSQTITFKDLTLSNISLTGRNITFFSYSGSGSCTDPPGPVRMFWVLTFPDIVYRLPSSAAKNCSS